MTIELERFSAPLHAEDTLITKESVEHQSGLAIDYVSVSDGYEGGKYRAFIQNKLSHYETYLQQHPGITADSENNSAREFLDNIPTIKSWKSMMPSAMALYPLQRPEETYLPNGTKVDRFTRLLFRHGLDAIGIRSRAKIMESISLRQVRDSDEDSTRWISLACGAAVPVLDAVANIKKEMPDRDFSLTLVDLDRTALEFARELASAQGLREGTDFEAERVNLIRGLIKNDELVTTHGKESYDMVDMLGIFEYFADDHAQTMLKNAYRLLKPGGKLIIGNMLDTHPNLRFNQVAVGWPGVKPRSFDEIANVITNAGIDIKQCQAYVPEDGVYAVVEIGKQTQNEASAPSQRQLGSTALTQK